MDDLDLIAAKRNYHVKTAEAWRVYDAAVNPARLIRDAALEAGADAEKTWKEFNEATLPARIVFETTIKPTRVVRDAHVLRKAKEMRVEEMTDGVS